MTKDFVMFSSGAPRDLGGCHRVEPVKCFGIVVQFDGHPGLDQALRVVNTLVLQRVVIDRHHVRRRKAAKVTRARRSGIGRHLPAGPLTQIMRPHAFGGSAVPALDVWPDVIKAQGCTSSFARVTGARCRISSSLTTAGLSRVPKTRSTPQVFSTEEMWGSAHLQNKYPGKRGSSRVTHRSDL